MNRGVNPGRYLSQGRDGPRRGEIPSRYTDSDDSMRDRGYPEYGGSRSGRMSGGRGYDESSSSRQYSDVESQYTQYQGSGDRDAGRGRGMQGPGYTDAAPIPTRGRPDMQPAASSGTPSKDPSRARGGRGGAGGRALYTGGLGFQY